jgi:hypothetical protein
LYTSPGQRERIYPAPPPTRYAWRVAVLVIFEIQAAWTVRTTAHRTTARTGTVVAMMAESGGERQEYGPDF